eukprot:197195_1
MGSELSQLECCPGKVKDIVPKHPQTSLQPEPRLHTSTSLKFKEEAKLNHLIKPRKATPKLHAIFDTNNLRVPSPSSSFVSDDNMSRSISHSLPMPKPHGLSIQIPQSLTTPADDKFEEAVIVSSESHHTKVHQSSLKPEEDEDVSFGGPIYQILSPSPDSSSAVTPVMITSNWSAHSPSMDPQCALAPTPSAYSPCPHHAHFPDTYLVSEEEETEDEDAFEEQHRVENCLAVKRMIQALQWYATHGHDHQSVYEKVKYGLYGKQLFDDYHHVMDIHLQHTLVHIHDDMMSDYHWICAQVDKHVKPCPHTKCIGYRRYLRWKHCANVHKAQTQKQYQIQTYVNTMDGIHCCFLHLAKQSKK